jgi:phosphatidylglycerophosphate synthase
VISGLREFLSAIGLELPVLRLAKYKTTIQMIAIVCLLCGRKIFPIQSVSLLGDVMLWFACVLTIITGVNYVCLAVTFVKILQKQSRQVILKTKRRRKFRAQI